LDPRQNLGFGLGSVFPQNCIFSFGFKTNPAIRSDNISETVLDGEVVVVSDILVMTIFDDLS